MKTKLERDHSLLYDRDNCRLYSTRSEIPMVSTVIVEAEEQFGGVFVQVDVDLTMITANGPMLRYREIYGVVGDLWVIVPNGDHYLVNNQFFKPAQFNKDTVKLFIIVQEGESCARLSTGGARVTQSVASLSAKLKEIEST